MGGHHGGCDGEDVAVDVQAVEVHVGEGIVLDEGVEVNAALESDGIGCCPAP